MSQQLLNHDAASNYTGNPKQQQKHVDFLTISHSNANSKSVSNSIVNSLDRKIDDTKDKNDSSDEFKFAKLQANNLASHQIKHKENGNERTDTAGTLATLDFNAFKIDNTSINPTRNTPLRSVGNSIIKPNEISYSRFANNEQLATDDTLNSNHILPVVTNNLVNIPKSHYSLSSTRLNTPNIISGAIPTNNKIFNNHLTSHMNQDSMKRSSNRDDYIPPYNYSPSSTRPGTAFTMFAEDEDSNTYKFLNTVGYSITF